MTIEDFVAAFAAQFDETDASVFTPQTEYHSLEEWTSLTALSIIGMADQEYGVQLKGDDIRNARTVEDLYNIVKSRM